MILFAGLRENAAVVLLPSLFQEELAGIVTCNGVSNFAQFYLL